jgi:hypothetical protein
MSEFHGWSSKKLNLYIGRLPHRKAVALYQIRGSVLNVLAYFRSKEDALAAMQTIDAMVSFTTEQQ